MGSLPTVDSVFQLGDLIAKSLSTIRKECTSKNLSLPKLDSFGTISQNESFRDNPAANEAAKIAASACLQLAATLMPAQEWTFMVAVGDHRSAALRVCLEANVTETLREAGPEGMHVDAIAKRCNIDSCKLGRIMRYLATHYIYREISPDVFTNNRNSGALDTGKNVKDILSDPDAKYDSTGLPALCSHVLDVNHKSSAVLWDHLIDPTTASSTDLVKTAFSRGLGIEKTYWQCLASSDPVNRLRHRRFGFAMKGMAKIQPGGMIFEAFDWDHLPKNAVVIDVGGGLGHATMPLVKKFSQMRLVIEDMPKVLEETERFWQRECPDGLDSGRVRLEAQDFFLPRAPLDADVFFVKNILHNWHQSDIIKILKNLRQAATPKTRLIIVDGVLPYACRRAPDSVLTDNPEDDMRKVELEYKEAPEPLLPNYGALADQTHWLDMTMLFYFNGQELTTLMLQEVLSTSGWRLVRFRNVDPRNQFVQSIEAVPK